VDAKTITATLDHFSYYAVGEKEVENGGGTNLALVAVALITVFSVIGIILYALREKIFGTE